MRIAFFTETFLPNVDGVVKTLCRTLDFLEERGHKTIVFAPSGGPRRYGKTPIVGLQGYPFFLYPQIKLVPPGLDVSEQLARFKPDLVHVLHPMTTGLAGLWSARKLRLPVVASYHTDVAGYADHYGFPFAREILLNYSKWIHNQADLNLCPSYETLSTLKNAGFERLGVWGRGVDAKLFRRYRWVRKCREWLSDGKTRSPLLVYVGRISPEKRIDRLKSLFERIPDARLAIVGDGPARAEMEKHFENTNTVFTGFVQGKQLGKIYSAADVFVFPSANETFGNVILEAMSCGLPVVAAAAGGPLDLIDDGTNGLLFPPDDALAMAENVCSILEQPELARSISEAGRITALSRSWNSILEGLVRRYESLAFGFKSSETTGVAESIVKRKMAKSSKPQLQQNRGRVLVAR